MRSAPQHHYGFNAAAKTVMLIDLPRVDLDRLLLIVNVTRNLVYYNFVDATVGTATVVANIITLTASMGAGADTDDLIIIYDEPEPIEVADDSELVLLQGIIDRLDFIAQALDPRYPADI